MPERHSDGSSSDSSSSSSSYGSSSSNSSSSWSHHDYDSGNRRPATPEEQAFGMAVLVIMVIGLAIFWIGNQISKSNDARKKADATRTTQAITQKDLAEMHAALDSRLSSWKEVQDMDVHRVSGEAAGFKPDSNTKEVDYGYCEKDRFYVYVLEESSPGGFTLADTEGYAYTPDTYPGGCHPANWSIVSDDNVGGGWHFVTIRTSQATYAVQQTMTPVTRTPTHTPTVPVPSATKE